MRTTLSSRACRIGFTLVELLVVIGIIALLISILLPAVTAARNQAKATVCLTNIRQVATAVIMYSTASKGWFPPNISTPAPGQYWDDDARVGQYLRNSNNPDQARTVLVCPNDEGSVKSYAMNVWVSSRVNSTIANASTGQLWRPSNTKSSEVMLLAEAWSTLAPIAGQWQAEPYIGYAGLTPGQRFGFGGGIGPPKVTARGSLITELAYYRHRSGSQHSAPQTGPVGRVSVAYVDGHAALRDASDLGYVENDRGMSLLTTLWSVADNRLNK